MVLDLRQYRVHIVPAVQRHFANGKEYTLDSLESYGTNLGVGSHVPIAAVYRYIEEVIGDTEILRSSIEKLDKFYGYDIIIL